MLVNELRSIDVDIVLHGLSFQVVIALNQGLIRHNIAIDGWRYPYKFLQPFLILGCLRLRRIKQPWQNLDLGILVEDALTDVANVISTAESQAMEGS